MQFELTSSQKKFYHNGFGSTQPIWNHGLIFSENKVFSDKVLCDTLNDLIKTYDSTRVRFKKEGDTAVSFIREFCYIEYPIYHFQNDDELHLFAKDVVDAPIDLFDNPFKQYIFKTPEKSGFILAGHHIVSDGFSTIAVAEYFHKRLFDTSYIHENYETYEQMITRELGHCQTKRFHRDSVFWGNQLSKDIEFTPFSGGMMISDFSEGSFTISLPDQLIKNINKVCESLDVTLPAILNAAVAIYLYRIKNCESFTIGVPVLNRTTQIEFNSFGLYMHIVPLIINMEDSPFSDCAQAINDSQFDLYRHQKFTQHDIIELMKEQGKSYNSLFDVICDYQVFEDTEYDLEAIYSSAVSVPVEFHLKKFGEDDLRLIVRYQKVIFSAAKAQEMADAILNIMNESCAAPTENISKLSIITAEKRSILLNDFNNTYDASTLSNGQTLYSLFEKQAVINSDKPCISACDKVITYGELLSKSAQTDCKIRELTGGKKGIVAVLCKRSIEMYTAVFGIIRGGNAYLPIEPDYPLERIEFMLSDSGAVAVLVQEEYSDLIKNIPVINMTELLNSHNNELILHAKAEENDTAYVIYTSGSTGKPKGAKITHRSIVNRILWMDKKYPLDNGVILQKTPYTFDVSVWELFWWAIKGAALAASRPNEHFLPEKIIREVFSHKVTHIHFVPSVFELFVSYLEKNTKMQEMLSTLEHIFLSGEALTPSLVNRFYELNISNTKLHNLYGPTECTVDVTYYDCKKGDDEIPIGKPISNVCIYILDRFNAPVPIGTIGELCVAGVGVGGGYLNRDELTAEKFIDNPFGEGKMYKTGDLAYYREDGNIMFVGRNDNQIKLSGQRIEISEIENTVNSVDGVTGCVISIQDGNIIAFYCANGAKEDIIISHCRQHLPKYMVPKKVIKLDNLPLSSNGKIDRSRLPHISLNDNGGEYEPPNSQTEKLICSIVSKRLKLDKVSINDDIFSIGVTSIDVIAILSEEIFKDITAADFIANPTVKTLSKFVDGKKGSKSLIKKLKNNNASRALLLVPFAGADASAYSALSQRLTDFNLYYVDFLHSTEDCQEAAKELLTLGEEDIYIYSHCAGSSVALTIISAFEELGGKIKKYIAAANIPPLTPPDTNMWEAVDDKSLFEILVSAGATLDSIDNDSAKRFIAAFREDTEFAFKASCIKSKKISSPTCAIICKNDLFTANYMEAEQCWKRYTETFDGVIYIDSKSHYFQTESCHKLVKIICSMANE